MIENKFPFSYFSTILSPKKIFKGRKNLTVMQMILTFIFLIFMLIIPVSINSDQVLKMDLGETMPTLWKQLDKVDMKEINQIDIKNNELINSTTRSIKNNIGIKMEESLFSKLNNGMNFKGNSLILKEAKGIETSLVYQDGMNFSDLSDTNSLKKMINKAWNNQNQPYIMISTVILSAFLIVLNVLLVTLGASFFIYLTRKNKNSSIKTFKESVNLVLNCLGLSTIVAVVFGVLFYDMSLMLTIQSLGMVLMLLAVFYKTNLNDSVNKSEG